MFVLPSPRFGFTINKHNIVKKRPTRIIKRQPGRKKDFLFD